MTSTSQLPDHFADLAPFLEWAQPTEVGRNAKRWRSSLEESQRFYDAMLERGPAALEYLGGFALDAISGPDRTLLNLCLALAECSATIEMYENPQPKYVFPIERFVPVHDTWDAANRGATL
ncbi:hypothetical protein [Novosphingobium sp.]|uniref:hypothetical protein n=1 Tax=Novosphingobium sp. TaxID=1874826 RepID=UPI00261493C2|nr:hypothetical protein [Novosphingobium sp.]